MTQTELFASPWAEQLDDPLAHDVATVLQRMGGSAHQDMVVNCVAALKRQRGESVTQDLRHRIIEVFERYREGQQTHADRSDDERVTISNAVD